MDIDQVRRYYSFHIILLQFLDLEEDFIQPSLSDLAGKDGKYVVFFSKSTQGI